MLLTAACLEKFPGTPRGVLGAAINGKLTELRLKVKKSDGGRAPGDAEDVQP